MSDEVRILELEAEPSMGIRLRTANDRIPEEVAEAFHELEAYAKAFGIVALGPPYALFLSYDEGWTEIECGIPVRAPGPAMGRVVASQLPGGRVARALHVGPHSRLMECYSRMMRHLGEAGERRAGIMWERYLDDPGTVPEESMRTEVLWLLE